MKEISFKILPVIFTCAVTICSAQVNLIPNPGFENNHSIGPCLNDTSQDYLRPDAWTQPSYPFAYCYIGHCYSNDDIPMNDYGYQMPFDGDSYVYFSIVWDTAWYPFRAYVQSKLNQKLEAGHRYCFSVYVSQSDSSARATDDFGAYFSDTAVYSDDQDVLPYVPQVQNPQGRFLDSKTDWMLVDGSFIAAGGEEYITIGNFLDDYHTTWIYTPPYGLHGYSWFYIGGYYIDMVSLYDCTDFYFNADAGDDISICLGDSVSLGTDDNAARKYSWSPAYGLSDSSSARPQAAPLHTTTYILTVVDEYVQQTFDTVIVSVDTACGSFPVFVANIFSPNGDGINDLVYVRSSFVKELNFRVYNRWGNLLFETTDINTGWDGRYSGKDCPEGVYFYAAEISFETGERIMKKGNISLIR